MLAAERRARILDATRHRGFVRISDLVRQLAVSRVTVRRDLDSLQRAGLLDKVHGGAVLHPAGTADAPAGPARRGRHLAALLPDGDAATAGLLAGARDVLDGARLSVHTHTGRCTGRCARLASLVGDGPGGRAAGAVDGLLLQPAPGCDADWLGRLARLRTPVVLTDYLAPADAARLPCSVTTDHERGVALVADHLRRLGHRQVAYLPAGPPALAARLAGYWAALTEPGRAMPVLPAGVEGARALAALRSSGATAVFCPHEPTARALLGHAAAAGVPVPDALSVVTADEGRAGVSTPPLTALAAPRVGVGRQAVRMLWDLADAGGAGSVRHLRLEPRLVVRGSSAAPPG